MYAYLQSEKNTSESTRNRTRRLICKDEPQPTHNPSSGKL
jgi:hypothetical protein